MADITQYSVLDPLAYINNSFNPEPAAEESDTTHQTFSRFLLKCLAKFFKEEVVSGCSLKVLDYGCGPSLAYSISAASKATEIVLAEYNESNRECLQKWLDGDASAHDWTPYFKYVVQTLEGGSEEEAKQRERDLRSKVKAVVPCDLHKHEFIDKCYKDEYDVVMSFLCLQNAVDDLDGYNSAIAKLSSLIKERGQLVLLSTIQETSDAIFYFVNGIKYHNIALKRDVILETLKKNGFTISTKKYLQLPPHYPEGNCDGILFVSACKV